MASPSRILLLQLKRIGDTILTAPAVAAIQRRFPAARLALVVEHACGPIAACIGSGIDVWTFRRGSLNPGLLARIAGGGFDTVLDFTGNDRSAFLTVLARAGRRITFERRGAHGLRRRIYTDTPAVPVRDLHTIDYHLALLEPLGVRGASRAIPLGPDAVAASKAAALIDGLGDYFVLHPGTARPEKYWVANRWAAVANACAERTGWTCLLTGTRDSFEQEHVAGVRAALKCPMRDLTGATSLAVLLALLGRARLLLGVDSAPMHLAAACGTPQIALFGPTNPFHWRPVQEQAITLQAGNPESDFTDPRRPGAPMERLAEDPVLACLSKFP